MDTDNEKTAGLGILTILSAFLCGSIPSTGRIPTTAVGKILLVTPLITTGY